MTSIEGTLSAFIDAWNAGERPNVTEYLDRVAPEDRAALGDEIGMWLEIAPTPDFDEATRAEIASDPVLVAALAAGMRSLPWGARLRDAREQAGLAIGELATRAAEAVGLPSGQKDRAAEYLDRAERGELDERRVSRRLADALAGVLGTDRDALRPDWAPMAAPAASAVQFRADGDVDTERLGAAIDALAQAAAAPAPEPLDEVDRLFLGGPEG